ncbi:unnamed protein product, partial [Adineta steineri]
EKFTIQKFEKSLVLILLILVLTYFSFRTCYSQRNLIDIKIKQNHTSTRINVFIITYSCISLRFNVTKENIERVFPNYVNIYCFKSIPLNDSRIHTSPTSILKKLSSNLLSFINVWTYEIPKYSKNGDLEWSLVFEDDVNFVEPSKFSLSNYINILQDIMQNSEIQLNHGFFYLGICGPTFSKNNTSLVTKFPNNTLLSTKGYGWCAHGMGLTTKRAKEFWTHISSYRPTPDAAVDFFIREYCIRSKTDYYIIGSNYHWPPGTRHYGIAYQDRGRFSSGMY